MSLLLNRITLALCLILAACAVYFHFNDPLWNDEIYTLQKFVFKGFVQIVTDYHVPNNHIMANILYWLWVQITGIADIGVILDHPWRIRLVTLLVSAGTVWFVFQAGRALQDASTGWLSVLMLLTGVTFQAYAFQIRGYAPGMLTAAVMLYFTIQWMAGKPLKGLPFLALTAAAAASLYTLPSNLYVWAAGVVGIVLAQASVARREGWKGMWQPLSAMLLGGMVAFAAYQPVLNQMLNSDYFTTGKALQQEHARQFYSTMLGFSGFRLFFLAFIFTGAYYSWKQGGRSRMLLIYLLTALLGPFLFSALRGDTPPLRVFTVLLPVYSVAVVFGAMHTFARTKILNNYSFFIYLAAACYVLDMLRITTNLKSNLDTKNHYYPGINFNYYQHYYNPNSEYNTFRKQYGPNQVLILESSEEHDLPVYLRHKKQAFVPLDSIERYIRARKTMYVSSNYPSSFLEEMQKMRPAWKCRYLQPKPRIPRIIICEPVE